MPEPLAAKSDTERPGPQRPANLPVPVQQGEVLRPSSELWLMRALRTLFEIVGRLHACDVLIDDRPVPYAKELWLPLIWLLIW